MGPSELINEIALRIAEDSELQGWCETELGKKLNVFLGADEHNPPEITDLPGCALVDIIQVRGDGQQHIVFKLDLRCALVNEEITNPLANLFIYPGLAQIAELKSRIESVVYRMRPGAISTEDDLPPASEHPVYIGFSTLTITLPKSTRRAMR